MFFLIAKEALLFESEHSEALMKLRMLEDSSRHTRTTIEETVVTTAPKYVYSLLNLILFWILCFLSNCCFYPISSSFNLIILFFASFVVKLSGLTQLWEGQSAHVECRLEPYPDPSMKVEWFHNGKPLSFGSRFRTIYDFGFCALDLLQAVAEDSGVYEVRATNKNGTASSSIEISVKRK